MIAAIYARVSTEGQEKQETINSQLADLRNYAGQNNMDIVEEYIDNGFSGELFDRPALDKLRDDAKNRLFNAVIIHSPDRLSRKFIHSGLIQEELKKCGISIIFLNRPDSKDTPEDNLLNGIQGVIAEYEKAKILERTRRGRIHKAKSGHVIGNIPPYGYRYIDGKYEIDSAEAEIVKLIFGLFIDKRMKIRSIERELKRCNIPSRSGKLWRASTIHKILRNETYCGITYVNKLRSFEADNPKRHRRIKNTGKALRPKSEWIPIYLPESSIIIDRDTFNATQELLRRNLTDFNNGNSKHQYLLKGLVRCGKCGSAHCGSMSRGRMYYRCRNENYTFPAPKQCDARLINAERLESLVWHKFCELIRQPELVLLAKQIDEFTNIGKVDTRETIKSTEAKLSNTDREVDRILDLYREAVITEDKFRDQMQKINHKRELLDEELKKLTEVQKQAALNDQARRSIVEYCGIIAENLQDISSDFEAKRHLLTLIIEKIEIFKDHIKMHTIIPNLSDNSKCHILSMPSR
jgi:site-specific DNA recombinase